MKGIWKEEINDECILKSVWDCFNETFIYKKKKRKLKYASFNDKKINFLAINVPITPINTILFGLRDSGRMFLLISSIYEPFLNRSHQGCTLAELLGFIMCTGHIRLHVQRVWLSTYESFLLFNCVFIGKIYKVLAALWEHIKQECPFKDTQ